MAIIIDNTELWRRLDAIARDAQARREATNADPKDVPERRYDLGDGAGIMGLFDRYDDATAVKLCELSAKWFVRSNLGASLGDGLFSVTCPLLAQFERTTDEDGIECWILRVS